MGNCCSCCCGKTPPELAPAPESFPKSIEAYYQFYINWAKNPAFKCDKILVAYPASADDILTIVNWASKEGFRVRPTGQRHNWSPLTIGPHTGPDPKIVILDNRRYLHKTLKVDKSKKQVKAQPGMMLGDFLSSLEANDLGVPHTPAPYDITMGGVLAINGHGTAILSAEEKKKGVADNFGTLSNRIIAMTLCVYNEEKQEYVLREFTNADAEFPALQTAVGRNMMVDFTMQCVDNFYLRCRSTMEISDDDLFPEPPRGDDGKYKLPTGPIGERFPRKSYAHYVDKFGRSEIIWFPFTKRPWLKVWNEVPKSGPGLPYSRYMDESCPFTFADNVPKAATYMIKSALGIKEEAADYQLFTKERSDLTETVRKSCCGCCTGCCKDCCCPLKRPDSFPSVDDEDLYGDDNASLRPLLAAGLENLLGFGKEGWGNPELIENFGKTLATVSEFGLQSEDVWDIWGPSKNSLIYCRTSTARVTANGYVVMLPRAELQIAVYLFINLFRTLETKYKAEKKYPANMPLEIRVTGLDHPEAVGNKFSPWLSGCTTDGVADRILKNEPILLWLDNLSFPGTPSASEFYSEMEQKIVEMYTEYGMLVRPEWSKGWAYSVDGGAYTAKWFNDHTRKSLPHWNDAITVFDKLDPKRLFCNSYWDTFMSKVDESGSPVHDEVKAQEQEQLAKAKQFPALPTTHGAADGGVDHHEKEPKP